MEGYRIIKKINMNCPLCDMTHEVEERKRLSTITLKDDKITYEERYYYCSNADEDENEFETGSMTNENLLNARNAYRIKHGLLTSHEIVSIRERYGLSQVDLARLLGWGEATVARYESKSIQDDAYDSMLRLIKDNPLQALAFLKTNSNSFSDSKQREIRDRIIEQMDSYGKEFLSRQKLEGEYVEFEEPSDANGYTLLDIDKIETIISYFAKAVPNLFKVKLMKMLWYADAIFFKEYGNALTGMVYRHEAMGALPVGHYSLMNLDRLNIREEESRNYDLMLHIYPTEGIDYSVLNDKETKVLNMVIRKFAKFSAKDIVDYMHKERAYIETQSGDIIPFSLAKEVKDFAPEK